MGWFAWPLGLLALAAVPAVVALHLFRRRFEPRRVSALFLWAADDRAAVAGRKLERLHRNPSFWLELLAALALALACASPRLPWSAPARHLVVVLDGSFSMSAGALAGDDGGSARDRAVAAVSARLAALPRRSRATLVESGPRPRLLAGPAALPAEALAALARWQPRFGQHDLASALALAGELAGNGATWLVTDDFAPDRIPADVELTSVGAAVDNVGFTHAARVREAGGERLFATVTSFSRRREQRTLTIGAGATRLDARALTLEPGARHHLSFALPERTPTLELQLAGDALAADDSAWLAPVAPRTVTLATTCSPELARALQVWSGRDGAPLVDRWCALVPDSAAAEPGAAALELGSAPLPGAAAPDAGGGWHLVLHGNDAPTDRKDLIGPFLIERRHPLLRGLTLDGVVWSLDAALPWSGAPLICAGELPLLTESERDGARTFTLRIDAAHSSLQRSPDWPILLANAAEMRRRELPGPARVNLRAGESFELRGAGSAAYVARKLAGAEEAPREVVAHGTLRIDELECAGWWRIERGGAAVCDVAVQTLDAAESDLRQLEAGTRASALALAEIDASFSAVDAALLALALALLLADWIWLARRRHLAADPSPRAAAPHVPAGT